METQHKNGVIPIIMAGGLGKRMKSEVPKVLHVIAGKPMLCHVINTAQLLNPHKILIIVGKYKNIISETLIKFKQDLSNVIFVNQPEALGTGNALQCCLPYLKEDATTNMTSCLILSGDVPFLSMDVIDILVTNYSSSKNVVLGTTIIEDPTGYGRIITNIDGMFQKIVEDKDCDELDKCVQQVNCGVYLIDTTVLCKYLPKIDNNNKQNEYYLTDIFGMIKQDGDIVGENTVNPVIIPEFLQYQLQGVNNPEQLRQLENTYLTLHKGINIL